MKIFKFGGASIKDASGVKNVAKVLKQVGYNDVFLVVSAMGKMTNAFEKLTDAYFYNTNDLHLLIDEVREYHYKIIKDLFNNNKHEIFVEIENHFTEMTQFMIRNKSKEYSFVYDQLVSFAELFSTKIVSYYLNEIGLENSWLDVRDSIKTNSDYRDARVNWETTEQQILKNVDNKKLNITQGFLGRNENQHTTTLGREGSDYTAAIFAYCLDAESVTIWKDVEGVLNADPRHFEETTLLEKISYTEAIELAFYGASVIHPKTLQPLQKKEIPLYVKSFVNPENEGTLVIRGEAIYPEIPCFIVKKDQILLSVSSLDFSFIVERNISEIFNVLHEQKMKVNLIQNSAISFSICLEDKYENFESLIKILEDKFKVDFYKGASLFTIRHFSNDAIEQIEKYNNVLLKQLTKETVQIVIE
jgi:aspartate kinase